MQLTTFLLAAAPLFAAVFASPAVEPDFSRVESNKLLPRDKPKLNQYRTLADCQADRNILYHAAPVSGRCYDLDGQTGAFFWNTGGMLNPRVYTGKGCNGIEDPLAVSGRCIEKRNYNSYKCW